LLYAIASTTGLGGGGVTSVYKSLDNGDSWTKLTTPSPVLSTFALAAAAGKVYLGTGNGLQISGDGGLTWKSAAGVTGLTGNI
ncbi:hypothetical protein Q8G48_28785, partial [Klebsiella pneumoniae]|uniref:hypothetical protein n=1 Tax=Klebsiella pneumoniae TaxID=573 RepID=UPI003013BDC7